MKAIRPVSTLALLLFNLISSSAITLTMDELPLQPVNGLTFSGVTFHFTVGGLASTDAHYHAANGGIGTFVQDPSLEGNSAGVLTLDFAVPTTGLQFGVARETTGSLSPGLQVSLFDGGLAPLGNFSVNTTVLNVFSEGQFTSPLTIGRAVLTFPNVAGAPRFAIDNLTFAAIPEPAMATLAVLGLLAIGTLRRRLPRN
jgi:hypothetical protein